VRSDLSLNSDLLQRGVLLRPADVQAVTLVRIRVGVDDVPVLTPDDELLARHRRQGSDPLRSVRGSHLEARRGEQLLGAGRLFPARCGAPGNGEDRREEHNEASAATVIESAYSYHC